MRYKLQEVVINIWCGALDAAAMKREFQSVEDYENAYAKYKAKVEQAAIDDILDLLDKSVASVELADTYDIEGGEDPYDAYEMGFDRGVADVRKVIKEEAQMDSQPEVEERPVVTFRKELTDLINSYSLEQYCNTPDYIIAEYLVNQFNIYCNTKNDTEAWHGIVANHKRG